MMRFLEEVGIDFRDDEAIAYWKAARADVDGYRVRIDRALLMELVAKAPERFTFTARRYPGSSKIVLRAGCPLALARRLDRPFFFDQGGRLAADLGLAAVGGGSSAALGTARPQWCEGPDSR